MKKNMINSGIEWIGSIPCDWSIVRMQDVAEYKKGPFGSAITIDMFVEKDDNTFKVYEQKNAIQGDEKLGWYYINKSDYYNLIDFALKSGDIIVSCAGTIGKCFVLPENIEEGIINQALMRVRVDSSLDKKYFIYLFDIALDYMNKKFSNGSAIKNIPPFSILKKQRIAIPPITEQQKISYYLDEKCSKLDEIIADLEKQIMTLNNLKVSLINELVTKGLKENLEYKDSGVSWIGKIPSYWDISRILQLLKMPITDGPHTTPEMYDEGIPFVSAEAVSTGNGKINFDNIWGYISEDFYKECCRKYKPEVNDIYMIKSGATTGRVSILEEDVIFNIWSPLAVFRVNDKKMLPKFMFYSLQANFFQMQVQLGWTYGTQQNIGMRTLEHLKICVPPICEQKLIVEHLDTKCTELNNILECKQKQLEHMKQYKSSLIYEYVTGKKRVKVGE